MEDLGTGKLVKIGGGLLALIGAALAAAGSSSAGTFVFYGVLVVIGAGLLKLGDHLEKREAAQDVKSKAQENR